MAQETCRTYKDVADRYSEKASHRKRAGTLAGYASDVSEDSVGEGPCCPHCQAHLLTQHYRIRGDQKYHGNGAIDVESCPNGHFKRQTEVRKDAGALGSKR